MHDRIAGRRPGISPAARLDKAARQGLSILNRRFNTAIMPREDSVLYGRSDFWTRAVVAGDCEDYIVAKKQALIAAGWAADQVLYAVVEGVSSPYHAVLIVRTDQGDLVLDNLTDRIVDWRESGYRFVIRQAMENPNRWVRIINATPALRVATR